jgi:hypothetical protein
MLDVDTFLTALYVITDDFCHSHRPKKRPGPTASLSESEVLTLAIFARFCRFASERDFYRYAKSNLRDAFPTLPDRSQFNRCVRSQAGLIEEVALHLARIMEAQVSPYEALDASAMCPLGTPREGGLDGWPDRPTSDGLTAWGGTRAFACSLPSTPPGPSPASASPPLPPKTNPWPRPSSPCALKPIQGWGAWGRRLWGPTHSR